MHRTYDHHIKQIFAKSSNQDLFPELQIPRSTAKGWIDHGVRDVVTLPELDRDLGELITEIATLKVKVGALKAKETLVNTTFRIFGFQVQFRRLPNAEAKATLIDAVNAAAKIVPLATCLEGIGLSAARFRARCRKKMNCLLQDQSSCPKSSPQKLLATDIARIKDYVNSSRFAHFSIQALATFAKRARVVFASSSTWFRVTRDYDLRRPRHRTYPAKPKIGIRAHAPFQVWHIDLTILRLKDGTKGYVQVVLDNFSRYILAVAATSDYGAVSTRKLLLTAIAKAKDLGCRLIPDVMCNSGKENINGEVDALVSGDWIRRTIAQIDVEFSNSMIECWFRRLKHGHLFLQDLTIVSALARHVFDYTEDHNNVMPHSAFGGATPFEVITGINPQLVKGQLTVEHRNALAARIANNRQLRCGSCRSKDEPPEVQDSRV